MIGLVESVVGTWQFSVSPGFWVDLSEMDSVCSHKAPNRLQVLQEGTVLELADDPRDLYQYIVILQEPNAAELYLPDGSIISGSWTMLYDQGLIVETPSSRLYANFKHTLKPSFSSLETLEELEESSYEAFTSVCSETMVGIVQQADGSFACFLGQKLDRIVTESDEEV